MKSQSVKDPPPKRKRTPLVDAATMPEPISVEDDAACLKRELPPVDAAKSPAEREEAVSESRKSLESISDSDDITDFVDVPESTLEEELLKEVGLSVQESRKEE